MKTNMGSIDRFARIAGAVVIAGLYSSNIITGTWTIVLLVVAIAFTSFIGFCPLYLPFGLSTKRKKNTGAA